MDELRKSRPNYDGIAWLVALFVLIGADRYGLPVWSFPVIAAALAIPVAMVRLHGVGALQISRKPIFVYLLEIIVAALVIGACAGVVFLAKLTLGFGGPTERQCVVVLSGLLLAFVSSNLEIRSAARGQHGTG